MCKVLISGFYGFDNAGDEAILQSMISEFRKAILDVDIVVLSANPPKTARSYNVHAVNRSNLLQVCQAIKNCDILISGGGGLFQDATSVFSMWYYSGIVMLAFVLRKPVFAFAQGIGPVSNGFNKALLRYIMNRVYGISVRDKWSKRELEKLGVKRDVTCTVDPAFLIEPALKDESFKILRQECPDEKLERPRIAFSIRNWKNGVDVSGIFAEVADRVYRELGADVVFIPLHYRKDIRLAEEIAGKMKEKSLIIKKNYRPSELIGLYGLMDVNVGVRLHGLVFSLMNEVPMAAISYDPKIDSFMDSVGMENVLQYNKLSAEAVFNKVKEIWGRREKISRHIHEKKEEFKALARKGVDELIQLLESVENLDKDRKFR